MTAVIRLRMLRRSRNAGVLIDSEVLDVPASDITHTANCRTLAAEANREGLFATPIAWVTVSLICHERLESTNG